MRSLALDGLSRIGVPALPGFLRALEHKDASVRRDAVAMLGQMAASHPEAIPALEKATQDTDPEVQQEAKAALARVRRR